MAHAKGYVFCHIGNSRKNYEDNYLLGGQYMLPRQVRSMAKHRKLVSGDMSFSEEFCVAVSDGMGGYECGEVASLLTGQYMSAHYREFLDEVTSDCASINRFVTELNYFICNEKKKEKETQNMGATLCGVISVNKKRYCFNVGDSRMYQYSDDTLKQITVDNTEGQRLLDLGILTAEEIKTLPNRKAIYKYIGKEVELIPDVYEINNVKKGALLLLCTDGLSDVLDLNEIRDVLSKQYIKTEDKGKFLVEMAVEKKPDTGDNITLIIIEY